MRNAEDRADRIGLHDEDASAACDSSNSEAGSAAGLSPAKISLLYESRDGKLCLFEDASGHITAVRASKLV